MSIVTYDSDIAKKYNIAVAIIYSTIVNQYNISKKVLKSNEEYIILDINSISAYTGLELDSIQSAILKLQDENLINMIKFQSKSMKWYFKPVEQNSKNIFLHIGRPQVCIKNKDALNRVSLKRHIKESNEVLRQYWCDWIDTICDSPKLYLSGPMVDLAQKDLDKFSLDVDKKIEIMKIAIKSGYREIQWAIDKYNSSNKVNNNFANYSDIKSTGDQVVDEVF